MSADSDANTPGGAAGARAPATAAGHDHHIAPHAHEAGHAHGHSHDHHHSDHAHSHAHGHSRDHVAAKSLPEPQIPGFSLMRASLGERLALAAGFSALLWVAIAGVLWI